MQKPVPIFVIYNILQESQLGNPYHPGLLKIITNWSEGETFGLSFKDVRKDPHVSYLKG